MCNSFKYLVLQISKDVLSLISFDILFQRLHDDITKGRRPVWSGAKNSSNIDRQLKLQTRDARIILNVSEITTLSSILFQNLKWMPTNDYFDTIDNEYISIEIFI
jgi:hypothetical protein